MWVVVAAPVVVAAVVVASYFAAENTGADSVGGIAVVAGNCSETQSYLVYENSADDLCYSGTENLGSASLTDCHRRKALLHC